MTRRPIPGFVKVIAIGAAVLALLVAGVAYQISEVLHARQQADCETRVQGREDNRTMWLYLLETNSGKASQAEVDAFTEALNERLPPLECVNRIAVPVEDQ